MKLSNARAVAANILKEVIIEGKSLTQVLPKANDSNEISLTKELCFGVCRYYFQLKFILTRLLQKKIKTKEALVEILLLVGLYELIYLNTAEYAAVSEIVNSIKLLKKNWAVKLGNAILRNFLRNKEHLLAEVEKYPTAKFSHPKWIIKEIQEAWPLQWKKILQENNKPAPMILRVNHRLITTEDYQALLQEKNIHCDRSEIANSALILKKACNVNDLPFFNKGYCSVQDVSAQLAVSFLQLSPQLSVLDSCAAPGGKTSHILEQEKNLASLLALDNDAIRANRIHENMKRLNLNASIKISEAENLEDWWDGKFFDRILLDVPCSATGVIRRHPDIKLLRKNEDLKTLVETQRRLLMKLWQTLKPRGILLYVTCSLLPKENSENIQWFLQNQRDAKVISIKFPINHSELGLQLFPGDFLGDGFYYCALQKCLS